MKGPKAKERAKSDARMAAMLIEAVQAEYPSGDMPSDSVFIVFGMAAAAALSAQPLEVRMRCASIISDAIINTPDSLKAYAPKRTH